MARKTIVCIGDSLVAGEGDLAGRDGWVGRLREKLDPDQGRSNPGYNVYNLGIGGDTIRDVNHRLGEALIRNPDILILGCSGNDVKFYRYEDGSEERNIANYRAESNWKEVLDKIQPFPQTLVISNIQGYPEKDSNSPRFVPEGLRDKHAAFIKTECNSRNIPCLDSITLPEEHFSHGAHPNDKGYDLYFEQVYKKLKDLGYIS